MVIKDVLRKKLEDFHSFFAWAKDGAPNETDRETANYGLSKTLWMKEVLNNYEKEPKNIYLKQIHSGLSSVTRGVEAFNDKVVNEKFNEACNGIYDITTELEKVIRW